MDSNSTKINGDGAHMSTEDVLTSLGVSQKSTVSLPTMLFSAPSRSQGSLYALRSMDTVYFQSTLPVCQT